MDPNSEPHPEKKAMPSAWTRYYSGKGGKKGRVFHSTQGASEDLLDDNYRRLLVNGILWTIGLESKIIKDGPIEFVGPYNPSKYGIQKHVKGVKPADLQSFDSPIGATN